jgi:hypothetical protein
MRWRRHPRAGRRSRTGCARGAWAGTAGCGAAPGAARSPRPAPDAAERAGPRGRAAADSAPGPAACSASPPPFDPTAPHNSLGTPCTRPRLKTENSLKDTTDWNGEEKQSKKRAGWRRNALGGGETRRAQVGLNTGLLLPHTVHSIVAWK